MIKRNLTIRKFFSYALIVGFTFLTPQITSADAYSIFDSAIVSLSNLKEGTKQSVVQTVLQTANSITQSASTQSASTQSASVTSALNGGLQKVYGFAIDKTANLLVPFFVREESIKNPSLIIQNFSTTTSPQQNISIRPKSSASSNDATNKPAKSTASSSSVSSPQSSSVSLQIPNASQSSVNDILVRNILRRLTALESKSVATGPINQYITNTYVGGTSYSVPSDTTAQTNAIVNSVVSSAVSTLQQQINSITPSSSGAATNTFAFILATSTTATSSFAGNMSVGGNTSVVGSISAVTFYGDGSNLTGISSFSTSSVRSVLSTLGSLSYNNSTGAFSVASGYTIPLTASTTEWANSVTSIGSLNSSVSSLNSSVSTLNASATALTLLSNTLSASTSALTNITNTLTASTTALTSIANTLTASTSNLSLFWSTPSNRISAGTGLSWSGNTLNNTGVTSIGGLTGDVSTSSLGIVSNFGTSSARASLSVSGNVLTYNNSTGVFGFSTTSLSTSDIAEGSNQYFTNVRADTRADLRIGAATTTIQNMIPSSYIRPMISSSATGLVYDNSTGAFSLASGYTIPLTASTTEWANRTASQWTTVGSDIAYATGKVLIGTTTASTFNLDVRGAYGSQLAVGGAGQAGIIYLRRGTDGAAAASLGYTSAGEGGALTLTSGGGSGAITLNASGGSVSVVAANTAHSVFHSNGNFGVGTSTPIAKLSVTGTSGSINDLFTIASSSNARFFTIDSTGNVGIATTTPGFALTVAGDINLTGALRANGNAGTSGMVLQSTGTGTQWVATSSLGISGGGGGSGTVNSGLAGQAAFYAANGTAVSGTSTLFLFNENVGIGTTTPWARLTVAGEVGATHFTAASSTATSTFSGGLNVGGGALVHDWSSGLTTISNAALGAMTFDADSGMVSWIDMPVTSASASGTVQSYSAQIDGTPALTVYGLSDGAGSVNNIRLGVGTSTPTQALSVVGTINATNLLGGSTNLTVDANGNIIRDPSDENLKENIVTLEDSLSKIAKLRGVRYEWKDKERFGSSTEIGVIAQEVEMVVPEVVSSGGLYKSVNIKNLVALLIEGVKELKTKVEGVTAWFGTSGDRFNVKGMVCVDDVCVSKDQFKQMLINSGSYMSAPQQLSAPSTTTSSSSDSGSTTTTSTSGGSESTGGDNTNTGDSTVTSDSQNPPVNSVVTSPEVTSAPEPVPAPSSESTPASDSSSAPVE